MLPMEKARYRARATAWDLGEASTGAPQVAIEFEVVEGDQKGERITKYCFLTDAAAEYTLAALRTCGWTGNDLADGLPGLDKNVVEIVCAPEDGLPDKETGEVKQFLRVQFINKAGGIAMKTRLNDEQKRTLAAKMKAKLAALDAKEKREGNGAAPHAAGPIGPNPPGVTDDIPF
jgi:hypothetical protein